MLKVAAGGASGSLNYQGTWDASSNTPHLASGIGTKGYYYVVSVAGTTNLDGITDWQIGDWAVFNGVVWQKVDNTDLVTSVNGYTGAVVLGPTDVGATPNTAYVNAGGLITGGGRLTGNVTLSLTSVPIANVAGAVPNTTTITAGGILSGGGNLASNVTISLVNVPYQNVTGLGTMALQNANSVVITGGTAGNLSLSNTTIDGTAPYLNFANGASVAVAAGRQWYDGSTGSWNLGMGGGNITQQVGEELFIYGKASAAISDSPLQIIYQTGTVGASGVIQFGPTVAGITDSNIILGVATEPISSGSFGRISTFGIVHGINTSGSAVGETWTDGDVIWYNPVTGNPTHTKPSAPNIKCSVGTVIHAGPGSSGTFQVEIYPGSVLGGTDANVQLSASPTNQSFLTYDSSLGYWKDVTPAAACTSLGLGTISTQNANNVAITGGTIDNVTLTNATVVTSYVNASALRVTGLTGYMYANANSGNVTASTTIPVSAVTGAVANTVTITAGTGLTGGGNLSANVSLAVTANSTNQKITIKNNGVVVGSEPAINLLPGTNVTISTADDSANNTVNVTFSSSGGVTTFSAGTTGFTPNTATTGAVTLSGVLSIPNGGTNAAAFTAPSGNVSGLVFYNGTALVNDSTVTDVGYNTVTNTANFKNVAATGSVVSGSGLYENSKTIGANYTIGTGNNALSAGPVSISAGVTVTVPSGSRWVVM